MRIIEKIEAWSHHNITAKNTSTFEITKENHLTKRGDCIICVRSSKGASDLSEGFKCLGRMKDARITITFRLNHFKETAIGRGSPRLTFKHPTDLVARKSNYACDRTLMIATNKAAVDFSKAFLQYLKKPHQKINIVLTVEI